MIGSDGRVGGVKRSSEGSDGVEARAPEEGATDATGGDSVVSSRGRVDDEEAEEVDGPGEDFEDRDFLFKHKR